MGEKKQNRSKTWGWFWVLLTHLNSRPGSSLYSWGKRVLIRCKNSGVCQHQCICLSQDKTGFTVVFKFQWLRMSAFYNFPVCHMNWLGALADVFLTQDCHISLVSEAEKKKERKKRSESLPLVLEVSDGYDTGYDCSHFMGRRKSHGYTYFLREQKSDHCHGRQNRKYLRTAPTARLWEGVYRRHSKVPGPQTQRNPTHASSLQRNALIWTESFCPSSPVHPFWPNSRDCLVCDFRRSKFLAGIPQTGEELLHESQERASFVIPWPEHVDAAAAAAVQLTLMWHLLGAGRFA